MKSKMILRILSIWLVMWFLTWPAVLAHFQHGWPTLACKQYRNDLGFATGWSLFPPAWILAPFTTGFYEHGFQVFPLPRCTGRSP